MLVIMLQYKIDPSLRELYHRIPVGFEGSVNWIEGEHAGNYVYWSLEFLAILPLHGDILVKLNGPWLVHAQSPQICFADISMIFNLQQSPNPVVKSCGLV